MKRVSAGFYRDDVNVQLNDKLVLMEASIVMVKSYEWYWILYSKEGSIELGGNDLFTSKKDAMLSLKNAIRIGFKTYPNL
jgi:hypothetical protein